MSKSHPTDNDYLDRKIGFTTHFFVDRRHQILLAPPFTINARFLIDRIHRIRFSLQSHRRNWHHHRGIFTIFTLSNLPRISRFALERLAVALRPVLYSNECVVDSSSRELRSWNQDTTIKQCPSPFIWTSHHRRSWPIGKNVQISRGRGMCTTNCILGPRLNCSYHRTCIAYT